MDLRNALDPCHGVLTTRLQTLRATTRQGARRRSAAQVRPEMTVFGRCAQDSAAAAIRVEATVATAAPTTMIVPLPAGTVCRRGRKSVTRASAGRAIRSRWWSEWRFVQRIDNHGGPDV